jgi:hypothetical protein
MDKYGYFYLTLRLERGREGQKHYTVHRLVAMAFHGDTYFEGAQVNHKNYDRSDNCAENLEWVTAKENTVHSFANGRRSSTRSVRFL